MKSHTVEVRVRPNPDIRGRIMYDLYEMYLDGIVVHAQISYISRYDVLLQLFKHRVAPDTVDIKPFPLEREHKTFVSATCTLEKAVLPVTDPLPPPVQKEQPVKFNPITPGSMLTYRQRQVIHVLAEHGEDWLQLSKLAQQIDTTIEAAKLITSNLQDKGMLVLEGHGDPVVILTALGVRIEGLVNK